MFWSSILEIWSSPNAICDICDKIQICLEIHTLMHDWTQYLTTFNLCTSYKKHLRSRSADTFTCTVAALALNGTGAENSQKYVDFSSSIVSILLYIMSILSLSVLHLKMS